MSKIIKCMFFVLLAAVLPLSVHAQQVTLHLQDVTVRKAFRELEVKGNVSLVYEKNDVDLTRKVTVKVDNQPISKALDQILKGQELIYKIKDNHIIITRPVVQKSDKKRRINGVISDVNDELLIGVSVSIPGTNIGTVSNMEGKFELEIPEDAKKLQVSYIGFDTQEISLSPGKTTFNIVMGENVKMLSEVVVVGYGTQKKVNLTGSVATVNLEKESLSRPLVSASQALSGMTAGLQVMQSSGTPYNEGFSFNIRGVGTLNSSSPLVLVDGMEQSLNNVDPNDIASISILKDAASCAIYGNRGANGVILVTTKSGKEGKMSLNYSGTVTIENLQDYSEMMNSAEYIDWRRWSYYYLNPSKYPRGDQPTKENDYEIFLGATDPTAWKNIEKGWAGGTWDGSRVPNTDWCDMVTQTGVTHEHTLSASGGTDKMKGYASIGYLDNEGTVKGQSYTRYTTKLSLDLKPTKWFNLGLNVNGTFSEQQYGSSASSVGQLIKGMPSNLYAASTSLFPYASPYDEDGNRIEYPGGDDKVKNVMNEWNNSQNERRMFRAIGSLYAQLDLGEIYAPLKGLRYRFNFGPDFRYYRNGTFRNEESISSEGKNRASLSNQSDFSWTLDNLIYYDKEFGKHSVGLTLLQSATGYHYEESSMAAEGIPLESAKWNALSKENVSLLDEWNSGLIEKQLLSYMFRVNYDYNNKYLLTVSGRWDGASQLAEGNKWAFFPSAALGWRLDQEEFLKDVTWLNQLKFRLGVGVTGNSAIDPYQTKGAIVSLYYPFGSALAPGYAASEPLIKDGAVAMANKNLSWEKTTQYNIGLDYSVLNGRISGVLDFYTSRTTDLLMAMTIPSLNGYTNTYANVGKTSNIGVDITLNTVNVKTRDFEWSTSINAAWQKDKIDELANGKEDDINNNWFIGQALGVIYGYECGGLWKEEDAAEMAKFNAKGHSFQAGMVRPIDQNGDYKIDPNDDRVIIGHTRPRWTFGMTNTFTYKNFDLSVMMYGRFDYMVDTGGEWQGGRYMQRKINYYNENNKNAEYQKPIYNIGGGDPYYRIVGYKNGSFLKVRNISLGYTFPQTLIKKWNLSNLKVYVQAKNPGRIFSNIDFLELDASQAFTSTWNRGFTIGLNVGF